MTNIPTNSQKSEHFTTSDYLNMVAIRGEIVVQFWLRPGDEGVELSFMGQKSGGGLPSELDRIF